MKQKQKHEDMLGIYRTTSSRPVFTLWGSQKKKKDKKGQKTCLKK